jgi:hypothetical protein
MAGNIAAGLIYYYSVAATDRLENISAKCAPVGLVAEPVTSFDVNPAAPLTLTGLVSSGNGSYQSNDGTTWAYHTLSWTNPLDTRRSIINVLFRKVGAGTWHVADQTAGTTGRVDDLSPGQLYDFGVQPFSQFGVGGTITTLLNQTAPGDTIAPAQVTGLALSDQPPRALRATWTGVTADDLKHYQVDTATNSGFTTGLTTRYVKATEMVISSLVPGTTYFVRVRGIDWTGNLGTYSGTVSRAAPRTATDDYGDDSLTSPKRQDLNSQSSTTLSVVAATHTHPENANPTYATGATTGVNTITILPSTSVSFSHSLGKIPVTTSYTSNSNAITAVSLVNTTTINVVTYNHFNFGLGPIAVVQYW